MSRRVACCCGSRRAISFEPSNLALVRGPFAVGGSSGGGGRRPFANRLAAGGLILLIRLYWTAGRRPAERSRAAQNRVIDSRRLGRAVHQFLRAPLGVAAVAAAAAAERMMNGELRWAPAHFGVSTATRRLRTVSWLVSSRPNRAEPSRSEQVHRAAGHRRRAALIPAPFGGLPGGSAPRQ